MYTAPRMRGELSATAGKHELIVRVRPSSGQWHVTIDGRELIVDAERVKPGTWSLLVDDRSYLVDIDDSKRGTIVHTFTAETLVHLESAQRKRLAAQVGGRSGGPGGDEVIKAPIAGRLVKYLVAVGDVVEKGQGVAVLEAMKMENEIKAERGGAVLALHSQIERSVETGEKLLTLSHKG